MGVIPAIIGGVASIAGGAIAGAGAKGAAQVQADASRDAAAMQKSIFDQTRKDLSPFIRVGTGALANMNRLLPGGLQLGPGQSAGPVADDPSNPRKISVDTGSGTVEIDNPSYDPNKPNPNAEAQVGTNPSEAGTSPFLTGLQSMLPGGNDPALKAASALLPGGSDPLNSSLRSFIPGSGTAANPLLGNVMSFIPGSGQPQNASLTALQSLTPGGDSADLSALNGLLGLPTSASKDNQKAMVGDLFSRWNDALAKSGLSQDQFLATPEGKAFVTERNSVIDKIDDPHLLAQFQNGAPDAAENATKRLETLAAQGKPGAKGEAIQAALEATPGYQFVRDQGLKATQNSYAAKGLGNSGAAMRGAADYTTGLANATYEQRVQDYLNSYNSKYTNAQNSYNAQFTNGLNAYNTSFANTLNTTGQGFTNALNAYNSKFTNAFNAYGQQLDATGKLVTTGANAAANTGTIGQASGATIGNTLVGGANATAAGIVGSTNALTNSIGNVANIAGSYLNKPSQNDLTLSNFSHQPGESVNISGMYSK